jgi:hypothetical protein
MVPSGDRRMSAEDDDELKDARKRWDDHVSEVITIPPLPEGAER